MGAYWCTEVIPLAITSLLPMVLFPIFGILSTTKACEAFVNVSFANKIERINFLKLLFYLCNYWRAKNCAFNLLVFFLSLFIKLFYLFKINFSFSQIIVRFDGSINLIRRHVREHFFEMISIMYILLINCP